MNATAMDISAMLKMKNRRLMLEISRTRYIQLIQTGPLLDR